MTGKEIIVEAEERSEGSWRPSPGLIYPLLGRLSRDGLIEEGEGGKFNITSAGVRVLQDHSKFQKQLDRQFALVQKLGLSMFTAGKLVAEESMDRILGVTQAMKERMSQSSSELRTRFYENYREFLQNELIKIEESKNKGS